MAIEIEKKKKEIIRRIKDTNEEWILKSIQKLLDIPAEPIVAYTTSGKSLTKKAFIKEVLEASADVKAGNYTTHEDLKKEMRNW